MASWYRRNGWHRKGQKEFTKSGFENAKRNFKINDLEIDCFDKHYLITGANRGIGLEISIEIARRGGIVHFLCRNRQSMLEARSHVITTTGNDRLHMHTLDLSRPRDVSRWAQDFVTTHSQLDVLIHNAGAISEDRQLDEDGIEMMFAVNTLAVHILTIILLPLLQQSPDPRVINVSSAELLKVKLEPEDFSFEKLIPFDATLAYAQTKRQQCALSFCYAQRYEKVFFFSMHPGWVDTKFLKQSLPDLYVEVYSELRTPSQGADTVVWLAVSEAAKNHPSGSFFQDRVPISAHLPLAWTRHSLAEEKLFFKNIDKHLAMVSLNWVERTNHDLEDAPTVGLELCEPNETNSTSSSLEVTPEDLEPSDGQSIYENKPIPFTETENFVSSPNTTFEIHKLMDNAKKNGTISVNELSDIRPRSLSTIMEGSDGSSMNSEKSSKSLEYSKPNSINLEEFGVTILHENNDIDGSLSDVEVRI